MTIAMHFLCRFEGFRKFRTSGLCALLLMVLSIGSTLLADQPQPATAAANPPAAKEDFGQYLVDHKDDLAPFFDKNLEDLIRKAMPMVAWLLAWVLVVSLLVGWVVDIVLGHIFTPFFAPAYSKMPRLIFYSTGRLILGLVVLGLLTLTVWLSTRFLHAGIIILAVAMILAVVTVVLQVGWLTYVFRMRVGNSVIFYVIILGAQIITLILVSAPIVVGKPTALAYRFVNETMTPELQGEVDSTKQDLADINSSIDATKAKLADLKAKIAKDETDSEKLNQDIENKKNSEDFLFQKIVRVEAEGNLAAAHDQFSDMLAKYPNGELADSVKTHITQIETELATQAAQKKQADADAVAKAAADRADLLARAAKGQVTLSEMRQYLVGKNRLDVTDLLGQPAETATDAWGYAQQMIVNPMTDEKHGLTVIFVNGTVQSVDYYYGKTR